LAPAAKAAAGQQAAARVGGGFVGAPKAKAKSKPKAKPTSKAGSEQAETKTDVAEVAVAQPAEPEAIVADPPADEAAVEAEAGQTPPAEEADTEAKASAEDVKEEPSEPPPAEQQLTTIKRAMTCADHYVGMLKFEKAADKLEEQLVKLADDACQHRHTDLHVELLMKYGGVLWWEGDADGAVDAFAAADEILEDRPGPRGGDPKVKQRRAEIWMQCAQVFRLCGDLEGADDQLSTAVKNLQEIVDAAGPDAEGEYVDALKEAQAALAQVCVQKKEWDRAEGLYSAAFREPGDEEDSAGEEATFVEKLEMERDKLDELLRRQLATEGAEAESALKDEHTEGGSAKNQATGEEVAH